jgi:Na+-driven multidrug efflux pump
MGARLEYIMQPVAFGFGTAIVAMVGTNWGAGPDNRARQIAWTGALTTAAVCGTIGLIVAIQPSLWLGLFSNDPEVERIGAQYLRIVGPAYLFFGLGLGLFFVSQGFGRGVAAMSANAVRLIVSAGAGIGAAYWLGLGVPGFCAAVAAGFALYAALLMFTVFRVSDPEGSMQSQK